MMLKRIASGKDIEFKEAEEIIAEIYKYMFQSEPKKEDLQLLAWAFMFRPEKMDMIGEVARSTAFASHLHRMKTQFAWWSGEAFLDIIVGTPKNLKFIQVGVNDAVNADFIRQRAKYGNWKGLMIEPHPEYIKMAIRNYGACGDMIWENVAISSVSGDKPLNFIAEPPTDKPWSLGIASFDKAHLIKCGFKEEEISTVIVHCVQLNELIHKHNFHDIDLLVVDVEGHEMEVFKSVDFSSFSARLIILETKHMNREVFEEIVGLFPPSYRGVFCENCEDSIIYRKD